MVSIQLPLVEPLGFERVARTSLKDGSGDLLGFKKDPCCTEGSCWVEIQVALQESAYFLNSCLACLACLLSPVVGRTLKTYLGHYFCSSSAQKTEQVRALLH